MPDGPYTQAQLQAMNPRRPDEGVWAYSQRIGALMAQQNQQRAAQGPRLASDATMQARRGQMLSQVPQAKPADLNAPQGANEWDAAHWVRNKVLAPVMNAVDAVQAFQDRVPSAIGQMLVSPFDTPAARAAAVAKPAPIAATPGARAFAPSQQGQPLTSYKDARWGDFETLAEKKYGLPSGTLAMIRTRGERSNADQVSSAGARGVYQFIPATRDSVLKKYGVDAYGSPAQQAMAAAALLAENAKRTGSIAGAVQQYHGGTDPSNYGPENAAYMARTMGGAGGASGFVNPFDPSYFNQAAGELDKAGALAKQPVTAMFTPEAAPELPDAKQFIPAPTDFTKVDAAVEALKPQEIAEADKLRTRRQSWMRGIGEALMNTPESAGLGKVLAMIGGGAMVGSAQGDEIVKRDMEKFDAKMAQYNMAVLNNEGNKAQVKHQEAAQAADMLYKSAVAKYQQQFGLWEKFNNVQMDAQGNVVTSKRDPKTGTVTLHRVPNAAAIDAATAQGKADIWMRAGSVQAQGNALVATAQNGLIANQIALEMQRGTADDTTVLAAPAFIASAIVDGGGLPQLMQQAWAGSDQGTAEDGLRNLQATAQSQALLALGQNASTGNPITDAEQRAKLLNSREYQDAYRRSMVQQLQMLALTRPQFRKHLFDVGGAYVAGAAGMAKAERRTSTRTDAKGRVSTSTTTDYGDN